MALILELSGNFKIHDGQGVRLTVPARHKDIAELVGASRPRVTERLALFERKLLIVRYGRQLIVRRDRLDNFLAQRHSSASRYEFHLNGQLPRVPVRNRISDSA